jgi:hypothetical protein
MICGRKTAAAAALGALAGVDAFAPVALPSCRYFLPDPPARRLLLPLSLFPVSQNHPARPGDS